MKDKRFYYCYSYPQKEFLKKNGLRYILVANNMSTNKRYWVFESCEELDRLLQEWRDNRQLFFFIGIFEMNSYGGIDLWERN